MVSWFTPGSSSFPSTPFTNRGELSVPNSLANSTASLMRTFLGVLLLSDSNIISRRIARSTLLMSCSGRSGAAVVIWASSSATCATICSTVGSYSCESAALKLSALKNRANNCWTNAIRRWWRGSITTSLAWSSVRTGGSGCVMIFKYVSNIYSLIIYSIQPKKRPAKTTHRWILTSNYTLQRWLLGLRRRKTSKLH